MSMPTQGHSMFQSCAQHANRLGTLLMIVLSSRAHPTCGSTVLDGRCIWQSKHRKESEPLQQTQINQLEAKCAAIEHNKVFGEKEE